MALKHRMVSLGFPAFLERRALHAAAQGGITVLMYHEVLPDDVDLPSWLVLRASDFQVQANHLVHHYRVVSLDTALQLVTGPDVLHEDKRPLAVITFDDGYAGNLHCAAPVLCELGLPFTVYVATEKIERGGRYWYDDVICALLCHSGATLEISTSRGPLRYDGGRRNGAARWPEIDRVLTAIKNLPEDERQAIADQLDAAAAMPELRMMTPAEVGELAAMSRAEVGNHSHGHSMLDELGPEAARASLDAAQARLEQWTGRRPRHLSYPNGNYNAETMQLAHELGFETAVTTQSRRWQASDHPLEIPRLGVGRFDRLSLFRAKAAGLLE